MTPDDPLDRLDRLGDSEAPGPDAAFADRLEGRLRAVAASGPSLQPTPDRRPPRAARGLGLVAAAFLVVVVGAGVIVSSRGGEEMTALLASAEGAQVVRSDGSVEQARSGLVLGEDDEVRTGPRGRAVVDDLELGPNMVAVVRDGEVLVRDLPRRDLPTTVPAPSPTDGPRPTPPETQRTTTTRPTTTVAPTTTTSAPDEPQRQRLRLSGASRDGAVTLTWSKYEGDRFHAYLVLRSQPPAEPRYPASVDGDSDGRTTVLTAVRDVDRLRFVDRDPGGVRPRYRVVAVDADGHELARSPAVEVQVVGADSGGDAAGAAGGDDAMGATGDRR